MNLAQFMTRAVHAPFGKFIRHPIRSFRDDLNHNAVSRFSWGVDPVNFRRRVRSLCAAGFPAAFYLTFATLFFLGVIQFPFWGSLNLINARDLLEKVVALMRASAGAGCYWALILLFIQAYETDSAGRLQANWEDYQLTGMNGGQMFWGLTGPRWIGIFAASALHLILFTPGLFTHVYLWGFNPNFLFVLCMGVAPLVAILSCTLMNMALWVLAPGTVPRLVVTTLLGFLGSPYFMYYIVTLAQIRLFQGLSEVVALVEVLSWPPRLGIVLWAWRKAMEKLEAGEMAQPHLPT